MWTLYTRVAICLPVNLMYFFPSQKCPDLDDKNYMVGGQICLLKKKYVFLLVYLSYYHIDDIKM